MKITEDYLRENGFFLALECPENETISYYQSIYYTGLHMTDAGDHWVMSVDKEVIADDIVTELDLQEALKNI